MTSQVSPKVLGSSFGAALATLFWTISAATFWEGTFSDTELAGLTGATAAVVAGLLGYLVPDNLRQDPVAQPVVPAPVVERAVVLGPDNKPMDPYDPYA